MFLKEISHLINEKQGVVAALMKYTDFPYSRYKLYMRKTIYLEHNNLCYL